MIEQVGIQLPKEDQEQVDRMKQLIGKSFADNMSALKSINGGDDKAKPYLTVTSSKTDNEKDLDSKEPKPMLIDLELQKIDPTCKRLFTYFKYFLRHFCCDKISLPLMMLLAASIFFVIIGFILPDKNAIPVVVETPI